MMRALRRVPAAGAVRESLGEMFVFVNTGGGGEGGGGFGNNTASRGDLVQPVDRGAAGPSHLWDRHGRHVCHGARK